MPRICDMVFQGYPLAESKAALSESATQVEDPVMHVAVLCIQCCCMNYLLWGIQEWDKTIKGAETILTSHERRHLLRCSCHTATAVYLTLVACRIQHDSEALQLQSGRLKVKPPPRNPRNLKGKLWKQKKRVKMMLENMFRTHFQNRG